jgi:hypothetical protein
VAKLRKEATFYAGSYCHASTNSGLQSFFRALLEHKTAGLVQQVEGTPPLKPTADEVALVETDKPSHPAPAFSTNWQ